MGIRRQRPGAARVLRASIYIRPKDNILSLIHCQDLELKQSQKVTK